MQEPAQRPPYLTPARLAKLTALLALLQKISPRLSARAAFWLFLRPQRRELARTDAAFMDKARLHRVQAGTGQVQVYEWGSGARTALILHGWGSRASRFAPLIETLVARNWRVLAFDAPGHGLSQGRSSSLPQFMAALDAVAAGFGPVHALIGHSLGALAIVCARPAGAPAWFDNLGKQVLFSMPADVPFLVQAFRRMFGIGDATNLHLQRHFRQRFGTGPEAFIARPHALLRDLPTLVVHDRDDDIVPFAHGEAILPALTNARLLATDGLGHSALTRDAAIMQAVTEFLDAGPA